MTLHIILVEAEDGYTAVIETWTWSATTLREAVVFEICSAAAEGPKMCQKKIPTAFHVTSSLF